MIHSSDSSLAALCLPDPSQFDDEPTQQALCALLSRAADDLSDHRRAPYAAAPILLHRWLRAFGTQPPPGLPAGDAEYQKYILFALDGARALTCNTVDITTQEQARKQIEKDAVFRLGVVIGECAPPSELPQAADYFAGEMAEFCRMLLAPGAGLPFADPPRASLHHCANSFP